MRKGKSLHSRSLYVGMSPHVLKKLADQDGWTTAHKGGIKCCSDEKAMITEDILQTSKTELKSLPVSRNEENLIEEA